MMVKCTSLIDDGAMWHIGANYSYIYSAIMLLLLNFISYVLLVFPMHRLQDGCHYYVYTTHNANGIMSYKHYMFHDEKA